MGESNKNHVSPIGEKSGVFDQNETKITVKILHIRQLRDCYEELERGRNIWGDILLSLGCAAFGGFLSAWMTGADFITIRNVCFAAAFVLIPWAIILKYKEKNDASNIGEQMKIVLANYPEDDLREAEQKHSQDIKEQQEALKEQEKVVTENLFSGILGSIRKGANRDE